MIDPNSYELLAQKHRPQTREGLATAARQLISQGLKAHDVAAILHLSYHAALELLAETRVPAKQVNRD